MAARPKGDRVGRATQVPEVHGTAEAGDRAGRPARRAQRQRRLPRARDRRDPLLLLARQAAGGRSPRLAGKDGRQGYRDPESQAFIESWFSKLKERLVWRSEFETLDDARAAIAAYVESCHHRPHSGLGYRTPKEVRETWEDARESDATTNSRGLGWQRWRGPGQRGFWHL